MGVPVVMFHSVANDRPDRPPAFTLYAGADEFEAYLRFVRGRGYATVSLHDLHTWLSGGRPIPDRAIVLTFDDAYLDNWVVVAPLLRKYGFRGTVFVPTDFVQPEDEVRPTLEDVWAGRLPESELPLYGYLNRGEIRRLADSGTLDIQSHGRTHTWLPVSDEVVTFHHPRLALKPHLRWMWWNRFPERKPYWFQEIQHADLPWGSPVFRNDLALAGRAYVPDPELESRLVRRVAEDGGFRYFEQEGWRERLQQEVDDFKKERPAAVPESDAAFADRFRDEIEGSRLRLEELSGRPVRFLCWPNGGVCQEAFDAALRYGYLATTIPSRMARGGNHQGDPAHQIRRIGSTPFFHGSAVWPKTLSFAMQVERARGNALMNVPIKLIWLYRRLRPVRRQAKTEI